MSCGRAGGEEIGNGAPVKCRADQFRRSTVQRIVRTTNSTAASALNRLSCVSDRQVWKLSARSNAASRVRPDWKPCAKSVSFLAAVLAVIAGMIWGIVMAISRDHSAMPAHAHLNSLGWVSLFLFGIFYHLHSGVDRSKAALVQITAWIIGTIVLTIGVGSFTPGATSASPLPSADRSRCSRQYCCSVGWSCSGNTQRGLFGHLQSRRNRIRQFFGRKFVPTPLLTNCRV